MVFCVTLGEDDSHRKDSNLLSYKPKVCITVFPYSTEIKFTQTWVLQNQTQISELV